jgi:phenylpropionate dioxygenase-like ring-hydroxylating dioxygenase large terminal subunit
MSAVDRLTTAGRRASTGRRDWSAWPTYEAAALGLRNFWYPVLWSAQLDSRPTPMTLLGEKLFLLRDGGKPYALADRCPHRGVPLHLGSQEFPGTITCPYHGWTYGLRDGVLAAVITDGPDSPLCGRVAVRTYPVEERLGLVWVFVGDEGSDVPPVELDLPAELTHRPLTVGGRIESERAGNWRYAAENGFDEGHAKFLHRNSLWAGFRQMPVWHETDVLRTDDDAWVIRRQRAVHWEAEFPGLGHWTQARWWKRTKTVAKPGDSNKIDPQIARIGLPAKASVRLPYILRIAYPRFVHYEWAVPEDADHHRYVQLLVSFNRGAKGLRFKLEYLAYIRWAFHGRFTGQDAWIVNVMDCPPERLYRPDRSVLEYRRLVEQQHRQDGYLFPPGSASPSPVDPAPDGPRG